MGWSALTAMNTDRTWTNFHTSYPEARLTCYAYESSEHVSKHVFQMEVLKMLQEYDIDVRFNGLDVQLIKGSNLTPVATGAIQDVRVFLVSLLN